MSVWEMQREVALTMAGHWHPGGDAACNTSCPMGDPRTREAFRRVLDRGMVGGDRPKLSGYGSR
jgi:hypothetical protein